MLQTKETHCRDDQYGEIDENNTGILFKIQQDYNYNIWTSISGIGQYWSSTGLILSAQTVITFVFYCKL